MNFKIDNGLVYVEAQMFAADTELINYDKMENWKLVTITEIESIFKSGKNTLTKIGNKVVQSVQDEKNVSQIAEDLHGTFIKNIEHDPWAKSEFSPTSKAEQNQKIVDELIRILKNHSKDHPTCVGCHEESDGIVDFFLKITGKNIKDL